MVDINEVYGSGNEYIKAEDIGNNMWTFTIRTADVKRFDDGSSKIILTFMEWEKGLPLNVTNARAIAELYGHNSNAWVGRQVMLLTMMVDYQGQKKKGVRIRAPIQQQPQQLPEPAHRQPGQLQPGQPAPQQAYQPPQGYQQQPAQTTQQLPPQLANSPQRPLEPQQTYAQATGTYDERNPPPPTSYQP